MKNILLLLTLSYCSLVVGANASEQWLDKLYEILPKQDTEVIEITGNSSRSVIAETMEVQIPVKSHAVELLDAYKHNKKITEGLVEKLIKIGFADEAIRSSLFSYSDHLDAMVKREKGEDRKYEIVTHTTVLVENAEQFILLAEILNDDTEPYDQIRYFHSQDAKYRQVVLTEAINDVKKQQEAYEERFDVRLELINIERKLSLPRLDRSMGAATEHMNYEATIVTKFITTPSATSEPVITEQNQSSEATSLNAVDEPKPQNEAASL